MTLCPLLRLANHQRNCRKPYPNTRFRIRQEVWVCHGKATHTFYILLGSTGTHRCCPDISPDRSPFDQYTFGHSTSSLPDILLLVEDYNLHTYRHERLSPADNRKEVSWDSGPPRFLLYSQAYNTRLCLLPDLTSSDIRKDNCLLPVNIE